MANYIVLIKEDTDASQEKGDRRTLYNAGVTRTAQFQKSLLQWLAEEGVSSQITGVGDPTVFPMVMLTCTPAVAKLIESRPDVEGVLLDSEQIALCA